jgi:hypothetical protein
MRQLQGISQRFEKIDELPIRERAEDPGAIRAKKAPAIRDKAFHRIRHTCMLVCAGINAVVLGPASYVMHVWYIRSQ